MRKGLITVILVLIISQVIVIGAKAESGVDLVWEMANGVNEVVTNAQVALHDNLSLNLGISTIGKMGSSTSQVFSVEQLGLNYQSNNLKLFAGASPVSIGQARIHQIFLRESGPAFMNVGYGFGHHHWLYTKLYGDLSKDSSIRRLGLHYFKWQPTSYFSLGIGEAFVVSDQFAGDLYYYTIPLMPYYLSKYFPGIPTSIDNAVFYGDGELKLPWITLYGELVVNEFPMVPNAKNPKLYGITLGFDSLALINGWNLLAEFSHVTDQAYSNGILENIYAYGDLSLGHVLGDDLTAADLQISKNLEKINTTAKLGFYHLRLGNTDVAPWIGQEEELIPENIYGIKLGLERDFKQLKLAFDLDLGRVNNYRHQADNQGYRTTAYLKASWQLP